MKSSLFLSAFLCSTLGFAQGTAPSPGQTRPASPASSEQLKARGPEAVAQHDPNKVVATIDGKPITAKQAADLLRALPPDQLKRLESNLPNVVQQLFMTQQLAQQALKENLDKQSPWKEQLELSRDNVLTQAYLANKSNSAASTPAEEPRQYYDAHQAEFDRAHLSGIFVAFNPPGTPASSASNSRTEDQAKAKATDIEKKLKAGGDFAALARTESDNQQAAAKGGDLGTHSMSEPQLPADVRTAIEKLQSGQASEPIRIPNAFLILKLDSRQKLSFDQARPEIVQKLQTERNQAAVKAEVDKYKIQVQDPDFFNQSTGSGAHIPSLQRPASASPQARAPQAQQ